MVAGCGNKCVKYIFWLLNLALFVLGAAIVGLATWIRFDPKALTNIASTVKINIDTSRLPLDSFYLILYACMAIGTVLFLLGFIGCCGACCESKCCMVVYFILILVLFVIEAVGVVLFFVYKPQIQNKFTNLFHDELAVKYYQSDLVRQTLDSVYSTLNCCGAYGCQDYGQGPFPQTCSYCPNMNGCANTIWQSIEQNITIATAISILVMVVEALCMLFSCVICGAVRPKHEV